MSLLQGTPYEAPVYLARSQASDGDGVGIVDTLMCNAAIQPPVILGLISAGASMTVQVQCSHDLVDWFDVSNGGFTTSFARSIVQGIRFWKVTVSNWASGTLTASIGTASSFNGGLLTPMLYTRTSVVTGA